MIKRIFFGRCALLSAVILSGGCSSDVDEPGEENSGREGVAIETDKLRAPVIAESKDERTDLIEKPTKKVAIEPAESLDLSLEGNFPLAEGAEANHNDKPVMDDLFKKNEPKASIGGQLLRDEENEDYVDSVEGAELDFEIKI